MRRRSLLALLLMMFSARLIGQMIGSCPPIAARTPIDIKELQGAVIDQNLAVIPKVKVRLQVASGKDFRDVGLTETDATGQFSFENQHYGEYRLLFTGTVGFCPATIPVRYSKAGLKGIRLTLPVAATDTCPQYCESRLKIEEMSGREGRE